MEGSATTERNGESEGVGPGGEQQAAAAGAVRRRAVPRRSTRGRKRAHAVEVTPNVLKSYFTLPLSTAASSLGVCTTFLKKLCREQGIPRWPYRQVRCMKDYLRRLEYLEALANSTAPGVDPNARMRVQLQLPRIQEAKAQLQALLEQVFEDPTVLRNSPLQRLREFVLRVTQACAAEGSRTIDDPFVLKRAMMLEAVRSAEACMSQGGSGDWGSPARGGNVPASHVPQDSMLPAGKRRRGSAGGAATRASEPSSNAQANPVLRAADAGAMGAQPLGPVPSQAAVPPWGQVAASTHAQPPAGAAAAAEMPKPAHAPLPTSGPLVAGSAPAPSGGGLSQAVGHALSASAQWARMGGMSHPMQRGFPAVAPLGYAAPHMVAMNQFEPYMALMQGLQPYADPRLAAAVPSGYAPLFAVAPTPRSGTFSFPA